MTATVTGRVVCDWIENDPLERSKGRICYSDRRAGAETEGWVKRGRKDYCPEHADTEGTTSGKSWRQ